MRIITLNANGLRSARRKGLYEWLAGTTADVICLQETRIQDDLVAAGDFHLEGYHCAFHNAQRPGYSGVALFSRAAPGEVRQGIGWPDVDAEGRYLEARFPGLSVVSLYLPSGSSGDQRQGVKFDLMARLAGHLSWLRRQGREVVICGDWNIAHRRIDICNWRGNQKNSGFLPEERAWLDRVFGPLGWVDAFRRVNHEPHQYTWWSNRGRAWEKNVGWRIDYQVVTPALAERVTAGSIYKEQRFSDHAPLIIDYHP